MVQERKLLFGASKTAPTHLILCDDLTQSQSLNGTLISASTDDHQIIPALLTQAQILDESDIGNHIFTDVADLSQAQILDSVDDNRIIVTADLIQSQNLESTEAAISIRTFTSEILNVEGQAITVDVPIGTIDGDSLIAILATDGAGETHTADGAWTAIESSLSSGGHTLSVYERIVSGAEPATYTFTWTSDEKAVGVILLLRGQDNAAPLDKDGKSTGLSDEPVAVGLTPFKSNSLFLSINTHDQSGGSFYGITYPTGFTNEVNVGAGPQSGVAIQVGSKFLFSASAEPQQDWTMSNSDDWYTFSLIIKPGPDAFIVDSITQAQTLTQPIFNTAIDEISQAQTIDEADFLSSADDHQLFTDSITQGQLSDTIVVIDTIGSLLIVEDNFTRGTDGGTATAGVNTRVLDNVVVNSIAGASLATNQITLPAGTYEIEVIGGTARDVEEHRMYLYNVTDASDEIVGNSSYSNPTGGFNSQGPAQLQGRFTISSEKDFELRHYVGVTKATEGFGVNADDGVNVEIYVQVIIWKV